MEMHRSRIKYFETKASFVIISGNQDSRNTVYIIYHLHDIYQNATTIIIIIPKILCVFEEGTSK